MSQIGCCSDFNVWFGENRLFGGITLLVNSSGDSPDQA
jgi:hypothetical protein